MPAIRPLKVGAARVVVAVCCVALRVSDASDGRGWLDVVPESETCLRMVFRFSQKNGEIGMCYPARVDWSPDETVDQEHRPYHQDVQVAQGSWIASNTTTMCSSAIHKIADWSRVACVIQSTERSGSLRREWYKYAITWSPLHTLFERNSLSLHGSVDGYALAWFLVSDNTLLDNAPKIQTESFKVDSAASSVTFCAQWNDYSTCDAFFSQQGRRGFSKLSQRHDPHGRKVGLALYFPTPSRSAHSYEMKEQERLDKLEEERLEEMQRGYDEFGQAPSLSHRMRRVRRLWSQMGRSGS